MGLQIKDSVTCKQIGLNLGGSLFDFDSRPIYIENHNRNGVFTVASDKILRGCLIASFNLGTVHTNIIMFNEGADSGRNVPNDDDWFHEDMNRSNLVCSHLTYDELPVEIITI